MGDYIKYQYRQGGLMRCCLVTLAKKHEAYLGGDVDYTEGETLPCQWCSSSMTFVEGAWEWDKSRAPVHGTAPAQLYSVASPPEAEQAP